MKTREIPRSEWLSFFDSFNQTHEGWLVTLEEIARPAGPIAVEAHGLPLMGLSYDRSDDSIAIALGGSDGEHLTHIVPRPSAVTIEQTDGGIDQAVRVDPAHGPATRVNFKRDVRLGDLEDPPGQRHIEM
jgi:hypothetical protein